jgi:hypothetical protein
MTPRQSDAGQGLFQFAIGSADPFRTLLDPGRQASPNAPAYSTGVSSVSVSEMLVVLSHDQSG